MTPDQDVRFQACIPFILKEEGGYGNDPHDRGGATNLGIIQKEYDVYRQEKGLSTQSVRSILRSEAIDIYYNGTKSDHYWLPDCPKLPPGIDLLFLNCAVNSGHRRAVVMLQASLNISENSDEFTYEHEYIGPVTLKWLAQVDPNQLAQKMHDWYQRFYQSLDTFQYFGHNWLGRNDRALALAKTMMAAVPSKPQEKKVTDPTVQVPTNVNLTPLKSTPANFADVLKQIQSVMNAMKFGLPILTTFVPAAAPLVTLIPVLEEVLTLLEDVQGKSGQDLISTIGQHIQNIGQHLQTAAPHVGPVIQPPPQPYVPPTPNV